MLGEKQKPKPDSKNNPKEPVTTLFNLLYTTHRVVEGCQKLRKLPYPTHTPCPQYTKLLGQEMKRRVVRNEVNFGEKMDWEKRGSRPYVSESGLKNYLEDQGYSAAKIRKAVDPSNGDGLIGGMLQAKMIERIEHGWIVIDDTWASAMMLSNHGESK